MIYFIIISIFLALFNGVALADTNNYNEFSNSIKCNEVGLAVRSSSEKLNSIAISATPLTTVSVLGILPLSTDNTPLEGVVVTAYPIKNHPTDKNTEGISLAVAEEVPIETSTANEFGTWNMSLPSNQRYQLVYSYNNEKISSLTQEIFVGSSPIVLNLEDGSKIDLPSKEKLTLYSYLLITVAIVVILFGAILILENFIQKKRSV